MEDSYYHGPLPRSVLVSLRNIVRRAPFSSDAEPTHAESGFASWYNLEGGLTIGVWWPRLSRPGPNSGRSRGRPLGLRARGAPPGPSLMVGHPDPQSRSAVSLEYASGNHGFPGVVVRGTRQPAHPQRVERHATATERSGQQSSSEDTNGGFCVKRLNPG